MIGLSSDKTRIDCTGEWTLAHLANLNQKVKLLSPKTIAIISCIDASGITRMDTAGALVLTDLLKKLQIDEKKITLTGLKENFKPLFTDVSIKVCQGDLIPQDSTVRRNAFSTVGRWVFEKYSYLLHFFAFIGELAMLLFKVVLNPARIEWRASLRIIEETGYRALPIVGLMSFLIGIVLAYQLTHQLENYGATIFVVDVSGVGIFREFAPLITAIIVAGRTSTSFAALLGTMKVNEEIDVLQTMGIAPVERLVFPRLFGLIVALPLLTVWSDLFGIVGSMVMAKAMINLNFVAFLDRFKQVVTSRQLFLGLVKTPFFASTIASVGCFQGFQTKLNAESVGVQTTKAAVQSIFLIIVIDAGFSIIFSMMGY